MRAGEERDACLEDSRYTQLHCEGNIRAAAQPTRTACTCIWIGSIVLERAFRGFPNLVLGAQSARSHSLELPSAEHLELLANHCTDPSTDPTQAAFDPWNDPGEVSLMSLLSHSA